MGFLPLAAAMVSAVFSACLLSQFRARRRAHQLAWALALAAFAVASISAGVGILAGWSDGWFRSYYLFGAVVNVPILALGTIYLYFSPRLGWAAAVWVGVACVYAAVAVLSSDLQISLSGLRGQIPAGSEVMSPSIRLLSRMYSYSGFLVVLAGAIWSVFKLARRREARFQRLAQGNALIALGTVVVAVGSAFARYGQGAYFAFGLAAGVSIMFGGFLRTREPLARVANEPLVSSNDSLPGGQPAESTFSAEGCRP